MVHLFCLVVQELIGSVAYKLHTGRSRNDQVATDMRLWLKDQLLSLKQLLKSLISSLALNADE